MVQLVQIKRNTALSYDHEEQKGLPTGLSGRFFQEFLLKLILLLIS